MRETQPCRLEPEWTPLSSKSPAEALEPSYLRSYLSKEPLCPAFDPDTYTDSPSRLSLQGSPSLRNSDQQRPEPELGQTRAPHGRLGEYLPHAPPPSTSFLAPSVSPPAPASSSEIRLLIDRLGSLDGSIKLLQQRLEEHEKNTAGRDNSVKDANAHDGVGEEILQQVGQLGQEAQEAHLELHKDLEERSVRTRTAEKRFLGGLKELKDEMHRSKTEIDSLRSVVCQQSQMLGLIVEQHRTSMAQLSTIQISINSCLAERRDTPRSHQEFGAVRMLSPPEEAVPCDTDPSHKTTASLTSPSCTHLVDRLDASHLHDGSRDEGQLPERLNLMWTPAASMAPSEPEEATAETVEPTATDELTKVSITYTAQDEESVTDVIHVAHAMTSPAKKPKRSKRRALPYQTGLGSSEPKHRSTVLPSMKKIKLPQKARAPGMSRHTRLQDRRQQEQQDSGDKQLTSLFSDPVHLTRAKRAFLHMENKHLDLDAIAQRGLPLC
ncbi:unnamed protein product [Mortierella alpina]